MLYKNTFINKYLAENNIDVSIYNEDKPWGGYYVLESNAKFDKKILWIKPGTYLSLQYHGTKDHPGHKEEFTPLTKMKYAIGNIDVVNYPEKLTDDLNNLNILTAEPDKLVETPAGFLHAYLNPFDYDVYLLETRISTIEEDSESREANIVRIYDQTLRPGTVQWPADLIQRIKSEVSS